MATQKKFSRKGKQCYAFAITLTFRNPIRQSTGFRILYNRLIKQRSFMDYIFYPEYGQQGNFHFHGTIYYTNKIHFYSWVNLWRSNYGFVKLVELKDVVKWHLYCIKDRYHWNNKHISKYKINLKENMIIQKTVEDLIETIYVGYDDP